jgi:hypothetical protein
MMRKLISLVIGLSLCGSMFAASPEIIQDYLPGRTLYAIAAVANGDTDSA